MSSFSFSGQVSYIQISMAIYIKGVQAYQKKIKKKLNFPTSTNKLIDVITPEQVGPSVFGSSP